MWNENAFVHHTMYSIFNLYVFIRPYFYFEFFYASDNYGSLFMYQHDIVITLKLILGINWYFP